jgi:hypothetical protein
MKMPEFVKEKIRIAHRQYITVIKKTGLVFQKKSLLLTRRDGYFF